MNVEKEVDYVDLSTDKTPHYGNVIYDNSELNADNCRIDFDIDVSGIRELSFEYNGICDMTDILFGMSDAKLCS